MGVDHDVTLDTGLGSVGPAVATHPFPLALWTFVLPETSLLALVGCQPLSFGSGLCNIQLTTSYFEYLVNKINKIFNLLTFKGI